MGRMTDAGTNESAHGGRGPGHPDAGRRRRQRRDGRPTGLTRRGQGARVAVLPELFLCAYHPPTLYAEPEATDVVAGDGGLVDDARLEPLVAAARAHGVLVVCRRGGAPRRRPADVLLARRRPGRDRDGGLRQAEPVGARREGAVRSGNAGRRRCPSTAGGWRWASATTAASPSTGARRPRSTGRTGTCARRAIWRGPSTGATSTTPPGRWTTRCTSSSPTPSAGDAPWRFNGGAAIYEPEGRPLAKAPDEGEAIVMATLDPAELARARATHTMLLDRPQARSVPLRWSDVDRGPHAPDPGVCRP